MTGEVDGHAPVCDDRLVPLAGGFNFRDLGGYETIDGLRVRRQLLYRSGKLSALTDVDTAHLARKGIQVVCDLRTPDERQREPSLTAFSKAYRSWDYNVGHGLLRDAVSAEGATPQQVHDALAATYEAMPWLYAEMYGCALRHIVEGDLPLVFHCAGGKDRTGTLAALILTALGVPEQTVLADYMLTNRYLDVAALAAARVAGDATNDTAADAGFSSAHPDARDARAAAHLPPEPAARRAAGGAGAARLGACLCRRGAGHRQRRHRRPAAALAGAGRLGQAPGK